MAEKTQDPRRMTAADRYETMRAERNRFLNLARRVAELTIPSLIPWQGSTGTNEPTPFQSVGARGVNNLAAKLVLALFPPQGAFFRLTVEEGLIQELEDKDQQGTDIRAEIETALSRMEGAVQDRVEASNARTILSNAFKHLLVGGNYLLQELDGGRLKGFPLSRYVVKRDNEGEVIEIVALDELSPMSVPDKIRDMVRGDGDEQERQDDDADDTIKLYTRVTRDNKKWTVYQEVEGEIVEGSRGTYPLDAPAFIALRWNPVDGQSYGRSLGMEYLGDLESLESLSQSIVEFSSAAAKILFLVDPGSTTDVRDLRDAQSGDFVEGRSSDIETLMLDKVADFKVTKATADDIEHRLEEAFLLNSSVPRQAERVTATEIRFMAGELEQALGGVYSALSEELQKPLVNRWIKQMQKEDVLPRLPKGAVSPKIVTGIQGLGRQSDLQKLQVFGQGLKELFGPNAVATHVDVGEYAKRTLAALGIDGHGLVRSKEEIQAAMDRQRNQALQEKAIGPGIKAGSDLAQKTADIQSQQQQQPTQ